MSRVMSTNASNQIFNWQRFTTALRKEVVENKRQLLLGLLAMYLAFTVLMVLGNVIASNMFDSNVSSNVLMKVLPAAFVATVYTIIVAIAASLAFRQLTSKSGRIALFTSPSSNVEKFMVNLLIYVIGAAIAFFACAQLADLTRVIVLTPFKTPAFEVPDPMNYFSILLGSTAAMKSVGQEMLKDSASFYRATMIASLFLGPAIYFMGSVLWPRWAVVKSFACQQLINITLSFISWGIMLVTGHFSLMSLNASTAPEDFTLFLEKFTRINTYFGFAICTLFWVVSWFLFKRKDIISLKWWS